MNSILLSQELAKMAIASLTLGPVKMPVYVDPLSADAGGDVDQPMPIAPDPYRWIREQIEQGRRKFKEFKGSVCAIVLFPANGWGDELEEPDFVLGAMYGDYGGSRFRGMRPLGDSTANRSRDF